MMWRVDKFTTNRVLVGVAVIGLCLYAGQGLTAQGSTKPTLIAAETSTKKDRAKASKEAKQPLVERKIRAREISSYAAAPRDDDQPRMLVRRLQQAQDAIAYGRAGALENYREMLSEMSEKMLSLDAQVWSFERNVDAAAVYILIGGNMQVAKSALAQSTLDTISTMPIRAAIAFRERDFERAYTLLKDLNADLMPTSMGGQFALAKAMVTSSSDLDLTAKNLEQARKLAPGTLIEEAALRRHLRITGRNKDFVKFRQLSSIYMWRYNNSYYVNDFLRSYSYGLTQMPANTQSHTLADLKELMEELDEKQKTIILAYIARNATIMGKTELANWTANHALEIVEPGSKLHTRMKLYAVASSIIHEESIEDASNMLSEIIRDVLDANDKKLFDAVKALSLRLRSSSLEIDEIKKILRGEQHTFPGEEPKLPVALTNLAEKVKTNRLVTRFEELEKNYQQALPETNQ